MLRCVFGKCYPEFFFVFDGLTVSFSKISTPAMICAIVSHECFLYSPKIWRNECEALVIPIQNRSAGITRVTGIADTARKRKLSVIPRVTRQLWASIGPRSVFLQVPLSRRKFSGTNHDAAGPSKAGN